MRAARPGGPGSLGRQAWRHARRAAACGLAGWLAGCAAPPPPHGALSAAAASIEAARSAGAPEWSPVPWQTARRLLDQARALAQAERPAEAERLAEQADAVARLAEARSAAERDAVSRIPPRMPHQPSTAAAPDGESRSTPRPVSPALARPDPPAAALRGPAGAPRARPRRSRP